MKKNILNEEISRIKGMIGKVMNESFDDESIAQDGNPMDSESDDEEESEWDRTNGWGTSSKTDPDYKDPNSFKSQAKAKHDQILQSVKELKSIMLDRNDGPVTEFVVISRAVKLATEKLKSNGKMNYNDEAVANALFDALEQLKSSGGEYGSNEPVQAGY